MSADLDADLDADLRAALVERAEGLPRTPDPWTRTEGALLRERRRRRRGRLLVTAALVAVAALVVPAAVDSRGVIDDRGVADDRRGLAEDAQPPGRDDGMVGWPVRGSLAQDDAFLDAADALVARAGHPAGRLLYAGDVGERRVVLHLAPRAGGVGHVTAWTGPTGTDVSRLLPSGSAPVDLDVPVVSWSEVLPDRTGVWLVLTPAAPVAEGQQAGDGRVVVTVSTEPPFSMRGRVPRGFWSRTSTSSGLVQGLAPIAYDLGNGLGLARLVTVSVGQRTIYHGGFHVVAGETTSGLLRGVARVVTAIGGDPDSDAARVLAMVEGVAERYGYEPSEVLVIDLWSGRLTDVGAVQPGTRPAVALVVTARLPDGREVQSVREFHGRAPSNVRDVLPGRVVGEEVAPGRRGVAAWQDADDPQLLRLAGAEAVEAVYRGRRTTRVVLDDQGYGTLVVSGPFGIATPEHEVVSFFDSRGTLIGAAPVLPRGEAVRRSREQG